jgi:hypothetical protein
MVLGQVSDKVLAVPGILEVFVGGGPLRRSARTERAGLTYIFHDLKSFPRVKAQRTHTANSVREFKKM